MLPEDTGTRRRFLVVTGLAFSAIAGCAGKEEPEGTTELTGTPSTSVTGTSTSDEVGADLDLREANVIAVTFESASEGVFEFHVTLLHDDDGEAGYADWWQVESVDGTRLGRRDLLHAHGTELFTRSSSIKIPSEVTCVVVRGHDQTHEYGGQSSLVNVETGSTLQIAQGSEPEPISLEDCP